mgnify:CR=1 FL=1
MCTRCLPMGPGSIWGPPISIEKRTDSIRGCILHFWADSLIRCRRWHFRKHSAGNMGTGRFVSVLKNSAIHTKVQKQLAFLAV